MIDSDGKGYPHIYNYCPSNRVTKKENKIT